MPGAGEKNRYGHSTYQWGILFDWKKKRARLALMQFLHKSRAGLKVRQNLPCQVGFSIIDYFLGKVTCQVEIVMNRCCGNAWFRTKVIRVDFEG